MSLAFGVALRKHHDILASVPYPHTSPTQTARAAITNRVIQSATRTLTFRYPVYIFPVRTKRPVKYVVHGEVLHALYAEGGACVGPRGEDAYEDGERNERPKANDKPS